MRPSTDVAFDSILTTMKNLIASETDQVKKLNLVAMDTVISIIKRDWDTSVVSRVTEIESLIDFLGRGAVLAPESLRNQLNDAVNLVGEKRHDLRISALDECVDRLSRSLVDLQAWLESSVSNEGNKLLNETYVFLKIRAKRLAFFK